MSHALVLIEPSPHPLGPRLNLGSYITYLEHIKLSTGQLFEPLTCIDMILFNLFCTICFCQKAKDIGNVGVPTAATIFCHSKTYHYFHNNAYIIAVFFRV